MAFVTLLPLKVLETFATLAKVERLFGKRKDADVAWRKIMFDDYFEYESPI